MGTRLQGTLSADGAYLRRSLNVALAVLLTLSSAAPARANTKAIAGIFALAGATSRVAADATVTPTGPLSATLEIAEFADQGAVRSFDTEMTKKMHVIVVSDDFTIFMHVHPTLGARGRFRLALNVPAPGKYHVYADAVPHGYGQQVFRFDLTFGKAERRPRDLAPTLRTVVVGPYTVTLDTLLLDTSDVTMLTAHFARDGKPARDLHPYLGAPAHAVFIDGRDLSYVHVHAMPADAMAMAMGGMEMGPMKSLPDSAKINPSMMLHVAVKSPDRYKLWLQFKGGDVLYVAPFVLGAR